MPFDFPCAYDELNADDADHRFYVDLARGGGRTGSRTWGAAPVSGDGVLDDLRRALRAGGTLAFENRHPGARAWEHGTRDGTLRTVSTDDGPVRQWHETVEVALPPVTYDTFARNLDSGEETCERDVLAFRDGDALRGSLLRAGFGVTDVFGDWSRGPLDDDSPEIITLARRA